MRKQGESGKNTEKQKKTRRIRGKQKNTREQGESVENIEKHGQTGRIREKHRKTRQTRRGESGKDT